MSERLIPDPTPLEASLEAAFLATSPANNARRSAYERYAKMRMPNRRVEGWKWSDFNGALRGISPANESGAAPAIAASAFAAVDPIEIRIVNGRIDVPQDGGVDGLKFDVVDPDAALLAFGEHAIASLNVALTPGALQLRVKAGAEITRPVLIRHINDSAAPVFSRVTAVVENKSRLTVIETFEGRAAFHSAAFYANIGDDAALDRYLLQYGGDEMITHGLFAVEEGKNARLRQVSLSTGGRLARHETQIATPAVGADNEISSIALVRGERHCDFTSNVRHQGTDCTTRQSHKGVAEGRGRNVFQGKFHVERTAQKTDAQMSANALLLSDGAEANHKPELEIYADDVECAHGSTCGALDEDALFYLRQRGLDEQEARSLLIGAFVGEVIDGIESDALREVFASEVANWLEGA